MPGLQRPLHRHLLDLERLGHEGLDDEEDDRREREGLDDLDDEPADAVAGRGRGRLTFDVRALGDLLGERPAVDDLVAWLRHLSVADHA